MPTLVLIDSNAIVHRAYHALPKNLSNSKGERTNVTYGFALALIKILEELHPDYIIAAFDLAGPTFRHQEYKEYKATRVKADQELYDQIPRVREMLSTFGIPIYAIEGFEADDVIGTLVEQCLGSSKTAGQSRRLTSDQYESAGIPNPEGASGQDSKTAKNCSDDAVQLSSCPADLLIYIASGDRDVYQLLNGHVRVLMLKKGFSEAEIFDHDHLKEVYNLEPSDFIDLKALAGDASDNIPGVPGIGPKTATDLILKFDTLEKLYEQIDKLLNCSIADHTTPTPLLSKEGKKATAPSVSSPKIGEVRWGMIDDKAISEAATILEIKPRILKLLLEYKDQAFQSQRLATIRRDAPIKCDLEKARWGQHDKEKLRALFEELEFKSLLRRFSKDWEEEKEDKEDEDGKGRGKKKVTEEQKKKDEQLRLEL